jgi:predicted transcriptional regulator YdeE
MEPVIVEKGQILLAGMAFFGDPFAASGGWTEENEIGRLWQRFMAYLQHHDHPIPAIQNPEVCYELHIEHEATPEKGHYEVFVGVEVARLEGLPAQLSVKVLPPSSYAICTLKGEAITGDWSWQIYDEWLPASEYEPAHGYMFELYDERFKGLERLAESELDVYVPIRRREA